MVHSTNDEMSDLEVNEGMANRRERNQPPPLSGLSAPTREFLQTNYTKVELQKHCAHLKLTGYWVPKEQVIDKLMAHYSAINATPLVASHDPITVENNQGRVSEESRITELIERFDRFARETNDNFYVINNTLAEREKEIEDLQTKLFLAEEKIRNLQGALHRRNEACQDGNEPIPEKKTLLIGDSTLQEIKSSDLHENSLVRTLPEANFDMLKSWISEKFDHCPKECIIYGGMQDLLDESTDSEKALDDLGDLVANLKIKNSDVSVKVCELVPTLKSTEMTHKIDQFNSKLSNWCENNGVMFIRTQKYFKLGSGDIDINCYENFSSFDYDCLSRIGAIRLLDAVSSTCQDDFLCASWNDVRTKMPASNRKRSLIPTESRGSKHMNTAGARTFRSRIHQNRNNYEYKDLNGRHERDASVHIRNGRGYERENRFPVNNSHYSQSFVTIRGGNKRGCFNCGEFNHVQSRCRYDHKIKCNKCNEYGHKSRYCNYSQY